MTTQSKPMTDEHGTVRDHLGNFVGIDQPAVKLTDNDKFRGILEEFPNVWLSHGGILGRFQNKHGHGATLHSRAADLRKQGYDVECKVETVNGRKRSWYRLVTS